LHSSALSGSRVAGITVLGLGGTAWALPTPSVSGPPPTPPCVRCVSDQHRHVDIAGDVDHTYTGSPCRSRLRPVRRRATRRRVVYTTGTENLNTRRSSGSGRPTTARVNAQNATPTTAVLRSSEAARFPRGLQHRRRQYHRGAHARRSQQPNSAVDLQRRFQHLDRQSEARWCSPTSPPARRLRRCPASLLDCGQPRPTCSHDLRRAR